LAELIVLRKGNRLSITPVEPAHWKIIEKMLA
jgi:predicted RNA-binding protein with PUA-like domain